MSIREERELDLAPVARERQRILERPPRRLQAGAVAVEAEHQLAGEAEYFVQMLLSRGGAERCEGVGDPRLMQPHHIHVPLDDQQALEVDARLSCLVQPVELPALVKQRGFGRVEVFGLALVDDPAAESEHAAARIADRKHQAVAKTVVESALTAVLAAALIPFDDEPELRQAAALILLGAESIEQCVPGVGGVAERELGARGTVDAPLREIVAGPLAVG